MVGKTNPAPGPPIRLKGLEAGLLGGLDPPGGLKGDPPPEGRNRASMQKLACCWGCVLGVVLIDVVGGEIDADEPGGEGGGLVLGVVEAIVVGKLSDC